MVSSISVVMLMLLYLTPYRMSECARATGNETDLVGITICEQWDAIEVASLESLVRQHLHKLSIDDGSEVEVPSAYSIISTAHIANKTRTMCKDGLVDRRRASCTRLCPAYVFISLTGTRRTRCV